MTATHDGGAPLNSVQANLQRQAKPLRGWIRANTVLPQPPQPFPQDIATVQEGLEKLSQAECLISLDELMSRRPHNQVDIRWQIRLWRQDRLALGDARDKRAEKKEAEADGE